MNQETRCSECGAPLPAGSPEGHCPKCLLRRGLEPNTLDGTTGQSSQSARWTPPKPEELAARFPELEILELIGRGGMGAVYKARQKNLDRTVALKILPPEIGRDPAFADRFAREAQAMARLSHPHIVAIHDFGQRDGLFFFLMEYMDGLNLCQLMASGNVSPKEALAIVPQICDALQFAHDQGIVHRDIKPENILLDRRGQVKIADFGLVKLMGPSPPGAEATAERVMGTPPYMAPEQREHPQDVDHRADIYSLGVVFYQMLTGELPAKHIEPPSKKVVIDVRLDEVVLRALEKEPERRYQQASQVKTEVETIVSTSALPPVRDAGADQRSAEYERRAPGWDVRCLKCGFTEPWGKYGIRLLAQGRNWTIGWCSRCRWVRCHVIEQRRGTTGAATQGLGDGGKNVAANAAPSVPAGGKAGGPPRFSRTAIAGACWAALSLIPIIQMAMAKSLSPSQIGASPWWYALGLLDQRLLALTAPFGATILGCVALAQIRRSAGKLHGLGLAFFDAMLFPLLFLDALIVWASCFFSLWYAEFMGPPTFPPAPWASHPAPILWAFLAGLTCLVMDGLIIRWAWRKVDRSAGGSVQVPANGRPASPKATEPGATQVLRPALLTFAWHAMLLLVMLGLFVFVVPRFAEVFKDLKVALPASTALTLTVSHALTRGGFLLLPVLLVLDAGLCILAQYLAGRWLRHVWSALVVCGCGVIVLAAGVSLYLPMSSLAQNVSPSFAAKPETPNAHPKAPSTQAVMATGSLEATTTEPVTKWVCRAAVAEWDIVAVEVGQEVRLTVDALPKRKFQGTVAQVGNTPVAALNAVLYETMIDIANPDPSFKVGMSANVWFIEAHREDVLKTPSAAKPGAPLAFGPVIERVVKEVADLDTGKLASLPDSVKKDSIVQTVLGAVTWMESEGMDVLADTTPQFFGVGMRAVARDKGAWGQVTPSKVVEVLDASITKVSTYVMLGPLDGGATYVFQTREGGKGVLQILGFIDDGVKIRYKLVQMPSESDTPATTPRGDTILARDVRLSFADPTERDGSFHSRQSAGFSLNFLPIKDLPVLMAICTVGPNGFTLSLQRDVLEIAEGKQGGKIASYSWPATVERFEKVVPLPVQFGDKQYSCPVHFELQRRKDGPPSGSYWYCAYLSGKFPSATGDRAFEIVNLDQEMKFRNSPMGEGKEDAVLGIDRNGRGISEIEKVAELYAPFRLGSKRYRLTEIDPAKRRVAFREVAESEVPERNASAVSVQAMSFGPVIERVVYDPDATPQDCFIDLNTGKLVSIPDDPDLKARIRTHLLTAIDKEVRSWQSGKGVDATATVAMANGKVIQCGLKAVHLIAGRVANEAWEKWTPDQVKDNPGIDSSSWRFIPGTAELNLNTDGTFPATWIFRTDEGGIGILQIIGSTESQRGVKIRYKLVQTPAKASPTPESAAGQGAQLELLRVQLRQAEEALSALEARFQAGLMDQASVLAAKDNVEILKAQIAGDGVQVAKSRLAAAEHQLEIAEGKHKAGIMSTMEYQAAKNAVELRKAELRGTLAQPPAKASPSGESSFSPQRVRRFNAGIRVGTIACSPDGKLIAVGNDQPTMIMMQTPPSKVADNWQPMVEILNAETGTPIATLKLISKEEEAILAETQRAPYFEVNALAFSPDSTALAVGTSIGQVKLFGARTGNLVRSFDDVQGKKADAQTADRFVPLTRALGGVSSLAFSPDGSLLAMCGGSFADAPLTIDENHAVSEHIAPTAPGKLKLWDVKTGAFKRDLVGHAHAEAVVFSPDGKRLASLGSWYHGPGAESDYGSGVKIWDTVSGEMQRILVPVKGARAWSVAFSPDSKRVAIGTQRYDKDGDSSAVAVSLTHVASGITEWCQTVPGWSKTLAFSPDGKGVLVLCGGPGVQFLDTETGKLQNAIRRKDSPKPERWNDMAVAPQANRLAIGGNDAEKRGFVELWDLSGAAASGTSAPKQ